MLWARWGGGAGGREERHWSRELNDVRRCSCSRCSRIKAVQAKGPANGKLQRGAKPPGQQGPCDQSPGSKSTPKRQWGREENGVHLTRPWVATERCGLLSEMEASRRSGAGPCHDLPEGMGGRQQGSGDTSEVAATQAMPLICKTSRIGT